MPELRSQPASDTYRDNWERIFRPKPRVSMLEALEYCGIPLTLNEEIPIGEVWIVQEGRIDKIVGLGVKTNG